VEACRAIGYLTPAAQEGDVRIEWRTISRNHSDWFSHQRRVAEGSNRPCQVSGDTCVHMRNHIGP
jgi:hypothetical protein